jgi:hypothetical protein
MTVTAVHPASVRFTEEMLGHVTFGEEDFARGAAPDQSALKFHLTIEVEDIDAFGSDDTRQAGARGWIQCDALGGRLPVERGVFNLFVDTEPGVKRMLYRLWFRDSVGHPLTLSGHKLVRNNVGFDVWPATTTLYTRVLQGHVEEDDGAPVVASGVLRIRVRDFARQLTTFRAGGPSLGRQLRALVQFGVIFVQQLAQTYLRRGRGRGQQSQG